MSNQKQISTTALSKKFNIPSKEMFGHLLQKGFIEKKGDVWSLTNHGVGAGGKFVTSKRFGKYITWPEDFQLEITQENAQYERSQIEYSPRKTEQIPPWSYSMDTNIVRDAYRDFENESGQIGFSRKPNETIREWFKRQEWIVTEHFYEVYDIVRYSGELMDDQDGKWFIQELKNLSEKYFQEEV